MICLHFQISLTEDCLTKGAVLHEVVNSLGLRHEHSRPDRNGYVKIIEDNIDPSELVCAFVLSSFLA